VKKKFRLLVRRVDEDKWWVVFTVAAAIVVALAARNM